MRKDILLKDWCKKVRYCEQQEYVIKIGTYEVWDDDGFLTYTIADLVINGEIEATEELGTIKTPELIENIPASMKRKTKAFVEYFSACSTFEKNIYCIPNLVVV